MSEIFRHLCALRLMVAAGALQAVTVIDNAETGYHWSVVREREPVLRWGYPLTAGKAAISISDSSGKVVYTNDFDKPVSSCIWTAFTGSSPDHDDVFTCRIAYDDGTEQQARVALLRRVFTGETKVLPEAGSEWPRDFGPSAVLPYSTSWSSSPAGAAELTVSKRDTGRQELVVLDARAGFYAWNPRAKPAWGSGWFDLTLSLGGDPLTAELYRLAPGMLLFFR